MSRRLPHTTNGTENLDSDLAKIVDARHRFPSGKAASKPGLLAIRNIKKGWKVRAKGRRAAHG